MSLGLEKKLVCPYCGSENAKRYWEVDYENVNDDIKALIFPPPYEISLKPFVGCFGLVVIGVIAFFIQPGVVYLPYFTIPMVFGTPILLIAFIVCLVRRSRWPAQYSEWGNTCICLDCKKIFHRD